MRRPRSSSRNWSSRRATEEAHALYAERMKLETEAVRAELDVT
jgi:hypothetical protein